MKVSVLVENSVCKSVDSNVTSEHGISLYIELNGLKILFDVGQSNLFIQNSLEMGFDITNVDYLIISHGHFDHGGGLKDFLKINKRAKVFIHRKATNKFYAKIFGFIPYYIGLNQKVLSRNANRFIFVNQSIPIDKNIFLLEGFPEKFPKQESNKSLFEKVNNKLIPDKFKHELAMLIIEKDEMILFSGCSHSGIVNIIEKVRLLNNNMRIKAVFGGLHITNPITRKNESLDYLKELTVAIKKTGSIFYTGHCTGEINFRLMQGKLGNNIQTINTGKVIEI